MTTTPLRLTPAEALDPATVERVATAELAYDRIMTGRWDAAEWWALVSPEEQDRWRVKARALLADLVTGDEDTANRTP